MDGKKIRWLQIVSQHVPIYLQQFPSYSNRGWSNLDKISETGAAWHVDCVDMVEICRIPISRTFGRSQWHVIPEPPATLQGAVTWRNQCHDACHIAGCKNSTRHIENRFFAVFYFILFLMQFRHWRAAAFVSSPIHLLITDLMIITVREVELLNFVPCTLKILYIP